MLKITLIFLCVVVAEAKPVPYFHSSKPYKRHKAAWALCDQFKFPKLELTNETCVNIGVSWTKVPCCEWNEELPPGQNCKPNSKLFSPDEWCIIYPRNMGGIVPHVKIDPKCKGHGFPNPDKNKVYPEPRPPRELVLANHEEGLQAIKRHKVTMEWIQRGTMTSAKKIGGLGELVDVSAISKTDAPKLIAQNSHEFISVQSTALIGLVICSAVTLAVLRFYFSALTSSQEPLCAV